MGDLVSVLKSDVGFNQKLIEALYDPKETVRFSAIQDVLMHDGVLGASVADNYTVWLHIHDGKMPRPVPFAKLYDLVPTQSPIEEGYAWAHPFFNMKFEVPSYSGGKTKHFDYIMADCVK